VLASCEGIISRAFTDHMQLPVKYTVNRNMRRACCPMLCFAGPAGCCVGLVGNLLCCSGVFGSFMEMEAGRCRCLSSSVVMVEFIGRRTGEIDRFLIS
jgi:hypothetical protein